VAPLCSAGKRFERESAPPHRCLRPFDPLTYRDHHGSHDSGHRDYMIALIAAHQCDGAVWSTADGDLVGPNVMGSCGSEACQPLDGHAGRQTPFLGVAHQLRRPGGEAAVAVTQVEGLFTHGAGDP
jgi:hypothetical protein